VALVAQTLSPIAGPGHVRDKLTWNIWNRAGSTVEVWVDIVMVQVAPAGMRQARLAGARSPYHI